MPGSLVVQHSFWRGGIVLHSYRRRRWISAEHLQHSGSRSTTTCTDKTTIYGRYALYSEDDFTGTINNSPYVGYDTGQTNFNQNLTLNFTHVFTPNVVSSTKLNYNRLTNCNRWAPLP